MVFLAFFVFCWLGRFLLLCCVTGFSPFFLSIAFDAQGRHSSKTVTIVMMSAAQEQKRKTTVLDPPFPLLKNVLRDICLQRSFVMNLTS